MLNKTSKSTYFGFTLAEVLLTLTVIGIIASLTIPTLMQSTQETELKASFKKEYANIVAATHRILQDNAGSLIDVFQDPVGSLDENDEMRDKYLSYMNYIRKCDHGAPNPDTCWHNANQWKNLDNTLVAVNYISSSRAILTDGTFLVFKALNPNCTDNHGFGAVSCGYIYIDVNGFKLPNTFGRDIYFVHINKNGILPKGTQGDNSWNDCGTGTDGTGCAVRVLLGIDY